MGDTLIRNLLLTVSLLMLAMASLLFMTEVRQSRLVRWMLDRIQHSMKSVAHEKTMTMVERLLRDSMTANMLIAVLYFGFATGMATRLELSWWSVLMVLFLSIAVVINIARNPKLRPKWLHWADRLPKQTWLVGLLALLLGIVTGVFAIWM